MVYEMSVISIMKLKIEGFDSVYSGYRWRNGNWGFGGGCIMINRKAFSQITFRCYEFKNGQVLSEDEILDMDFFSARIHANKGIFLTSKHFNSRDEYYTINPKPLPLFLAIGNSLFVKYVVMRADIILRINVGLKIHLLLSRHHYSKDQEKTIISK